MRPATFSESHGADWFGRIRASSTNVFRERALYQLGWFFEPREGCGATERPRATDGDEFDH
jgi:hypothetical protein